MYSFLHHTIIMCPCVCVSVLIIMYKQENDGKCNMSVNSSFFNN